MHKSAVRQYRPDNIDLAVKKAELREVLKRFLSLFLIFSFFFFYTICHGSF